MSKERAKQGPGCPRCGYDLSGEVATWTQACPLTGKCPECGYRLEWGLVFRRQAGAAWWLFELDEVGPRRGFVRTAFEGLRPVRFWTAVRVEDGVRARRLAAFLVALALLAHVAIAGLSGAIVAKRVWGPWIPASWLGPAPPTPPFPGPPPLPIPPQSDWARFGEALTQGLRVAINPYAAWHPKLWFGAVPVAGPNSHAPPLGWSFVSGTIALFLLPLTIAAARGVFREGRAKSAHFWRVWVYGWIGPAAIVVVSAWLVLWLVALRVVPVRYLLPRHDEWGVFGRVDPTLWVGPAMFAWAARWWYVAAERYLKWERPLAVAMSACVASFFLVFGIMLLWRGWDYVVQI